MADLFYTMDTATWNHLADWAERETRSSEEAYALATTMRSLLETFTPEEADYSMGHGWSHVRNLL